MSVPKCILGLSGVAVAMSLIACEKPYHAPEERYVLVGANINLPYWQEAQAGLTDIGKTAGVKVEMVGPTSFAPQEELKAFNQVVDQKPAGILVSASDAAMFREPIDKAVLQGIPVICMDADSPDSRRVLFIGTDNFRAGQESGKIIAKVLAGTGNIAVISLTNQLNTEERRRGLEDSLKKYPGIKIVETIDDKGDPAVADDAVKELIKKKQKIDGIVGLEASGGQGAADALHLLDLTGKIKIVAFDKEPATLDAIERGWITATIAQKPYVMAFYGVRFLDDLHHNAVHEYKDWATAPAGPLPTFVDTGTAVIDSSNLTTFRKALAEHPKPVL
ncbi:MAG TPA: substrate-binding domain-containing protein [Terriglobales bacterium]|nr:substrate-binding domain-containing protein [Terriglobales bacterium]